MKLPFGSLDSLTPVEFSWLLEAKNEEDKDFYESMKYVTMIAYVSAKTGKNIPLFNEKSEPERKTVTKEEKEQELNYLKTKIEG